MQLKPLLNDFVMASEKAAAAAARWIGRNDEKAADEAAVKAMRHAFNEINFKGTIVIGEGERDAAPMLHIGDIVGKGEIPFDLAVDPLECTTRCAKGIGASMTAMVISEADMLLPAPDVYMKKIAAKEKVINLDESLEFNLKALATAKKCNVSDLKVAILDRERHQDLIAEVLSYGARIQLISDGDIAGAIMTCLPGGEVDLYIGTGGSPEGVITAAALSMLHGHFEGRLIFKDESQRSRAASMVKSDPDRKYDEEELININNRGAKGELAFIITGVTSGDLVKGAKFSNGKIITETLYLYRDSNGRITNRKIKTIIDEEEYSRL